MSCIKLLGSMCSKLHDPPRQSVNPGNQQIVEKLIPGSARLKLNDRASVLSVCGNVGTVEQNRQIENEDTLGCTAQISSSELWTRENRDGNTALMSEFRDGETFASNA